jgi:hypothetical protein
MPDTQIKLDEQGVATDEVITKEVEVPELEFDFGFG